MKTSTTSPTDETHHIVQYLPVPLVACGDPDWRVSTASKAAVTCPACLVEIGLNDWSFE